MSAIRSVEAWEVLDSRGDPTVRARVETDEGTGTFTVPSGASTGRHEAVEHRDGDDRFRGRGVSGAVRAVETELAPLVEGRAVTAQREIDAAMVAHDGTEALSNLGANAVLGVSGAVARAAASTLDEPLYRYLADDSPGVLPRPMVNVLSGGLHAAGGIAIQDILVVPTGATTYSGALETVWAVRQAVRDRIVDAGERPLVADEGGFAPDLPDPDAAFDLVEAGIRDAGHRPARDDVALAVDVAASHFHSSEEGRYHLRSDASALTSAEMVEELIEWVERRPIVSIEDPFAEDDWEAWAAFADRVGDATQVLGDDLLVTTRDRLDRAVEAGAANAILIKPNQAGTLSRATATLRAARERGMATVVSARSGETCDSTIADLAVALDAGQIKIGSLARSERLAKYNRLIEIAREIGDEVADPGRLGGTQ